MDELKEKYQEWADRDHTHLIRQLNLLRRFVMNQRMWLDTICSKPVNSPEIKVDLRRLYLELGNIFDETREFMDDLTADKIMFVDILTLMEKEFEKLPDDND